MSLFKPDTDNQSAAYRNLRDAEWNGHLREYTLALWTRFEPYAEPGFREALSRDFHQRYWEMYLCCGLLNAGLTPESKPVAGPDFKIRARGRIIWVEAVVPTGGTGDDAVPGPANGEVQKVPAEQILLRLRSGVEDKSRKFLSYSKQAIVSADDCTVIAVNGGLIPHSLMETDPPRMLSALLPLGDRFVVLDRESGEIVDGGFHYRGNLTKQSGAEVATTLFTSEEYVHISAVLSCNSDAGNHPDTPDRIGSDFTLIHNRYAQTPLPRGLLPYGREYVVENDRVVGHIRDAEGAA